MKPRISRYISNMLISRKLKTFTQRVLMQITMREESNHKESDDPNLILVNAN